MGSGQVIFEVARGPARARSVGDTSLVEAKVSTDFYQEHLSRVSRSFAFCIEQMSSPERGWIGLSYILCRLIDTVEDSAWPSQTDQEAAFSTFIRFTEQIGRTQSQASTGPSSEQLRHWIGSFPQSLPDGEKLLVRDAEIFFRDLSAVQPAVRKNMCDRILDMSRGMLHFSKAFRSGGELWLTNSAQTNQYCFFVAGVVGELLTAIMGERILELKDEPRILLNSYHFGFYLQKVNLLKDYFHDAEQGRHFIPDFPSVRAEVDRHAVHALEYLLAIPESERPYRLFCGWSLFLGLASLKWIDLSWKAKKFKKIPRLEALAILNRVERKVSSNVELKSEFESFVSTTLTSVGEFEKGATAKASGEPWFAKIYSGRLPKEGMADLGMFEPAQNG